MQRFICVGNLTREPELTETPNGVKVCKFGIAVPRRFQKGETDFFNVVAWRGTAETCGKYLHKGNKVALSGSIQMRTWETDNGERRTACDVVVDEVEFLPNGAKTEEEVPHMTPVEDEGGDLPF